MKIFTNAAGRLTFCYKKLSIHFFPKKEFQKYRGWKEVDLDCDSFSYLGLQPILLVIWEKY